MFICTQYLTTFRVWWILLWCSCILWSCKQWGNQLHCMYSQSMIFFDFTSIKTTASNKPEFSIQWCPEVEANLVVIIVLLSLFTDFTSGRNIVPCITNLEKCEKCTQRYKFSYRLQCSTYTELTWCQELLKCNVTDWLTPWIRVLKKLILIQLVKKFPTFYGVCHWSLYWARWIQSTHSHPISLGSFQY